MGSDIVMKVPSMVLMSVILIFTTSLFVFKTSADDGILIAHGDHFEMTCKNDGFVDVSHTIVVTANKTWNVTINPNYSFEGILVGNVTYEADPEIYEPIEIQPSSKEGVSTINVSFKATLKPLKFTKLKLKYTVGDLLRQDENGTWHFSHIFNSFSGNPPEILLKIPKPPTQFHRLVIEDTLPAPDVFIEESHFYVLVWKSSLFTFGNVSTTLINVSYRTELNTESVGLWLVLILIGGVVTELSRRIWKKWLAPKLQDKSSE